MKKILLALGFTLVAASAQASIHPGPPVLQLFTNGAIVFSGDTHDVIDVAGTDALGGQFGQLFASQATTFLVTFLGKEAANTNFYLSNGSQVAGSGTNVVSVGQTFSFDIAAGVIDFGFTGTGGLTASNTNANNQRIAYITNDGSNIDANTGNPYAFLIGFNDGGSRDGDYDDYVVGVSTVPVPAALPLMASALGAFGIARRRNKAKAA